MKLHRNIRIDPGFLYLTPALDMAFILGLFVVLSTSFLLQPGVAVDVPRSPFLLAPQKNPRVLSITGAPKPTLYYENTEISIEEMAEKLDSEQRPGTLIIKAEKSAPYDLVLQVSAIALDLEIPVVLATDERK